MFRRWFQHPTRKLARASGAANRSRRAVPRLECLEDRLAPAVGLGLSQAPLPAPTASVGVTSQQMFAAGADAGAQPTVQLFNADGSLRDSFFAFDQGFVGGVRVATGDVNGDGFDDVIAGAGPGAAGGHITVFDGVTGDTLRSFFAFAGFTGGVFVASGDVNNDGFDDIIVGAGPGAGPNVRVFSGFDNSLLRSFFAFDPAFNGGVTVAAGNINGDSFADIIVGAGIGAGPNVRAFSGLDNTLIRSFFAFDPDFAGGVNVGAGDIDGDLLDDILVGAGFGAGPNVRAFSGFDNAMLRNFFAFDPGFSGGVRVGAFDFGLDGTDDFLLSTGLNSPAQLRLLNGPTLTPLFGSFLFSPVFNGGSFIG